MIFWAEEIDNMPLTKLKHCGGCNKDLNVLYFVKSKYTKDKLSTQCGKCNNKRGLEWRRDNLERSKESIKRWRHKNKDYLKDKIYKQSYGIGLKEFYKILAEQNGKCAICNIKLIIGRAKYSAHLDHDHQTGKIRKILCLMCNHGLGNFKDDITLLKKTIDYLECHH